MEPLTDREKELMATISEVAKGFLDVIGPLSGSPAKEDYHEVVLHIHALQNMVLAQAAARCYPHKYRLMGNLVLGQ